MPVGEASLVCVGDSEDELLEQGARKFLLQRAMRTAAHSINCQIAVLEPGSLIEIWDSFPTV